MPAPLPRELIEQMLQEWGRLLYPEKIEHVCLLAKSYLDLGRRLLYRDLHFCLLRTENNYPPDHPSWATENHRWTR